MTYQTQRTFAALAEPMRQDIYERLASHPQAVGELAAQLPISRPAVSQHLKVLKEAGLVTETSQGTKRIYRLDPRGIGAMRDWLDQMWSRALQDFAAYVENLDQTETLQTPTEKQEK